MLTDTDTLKTALLALNVIPVATLKLENDIGIPFTVGYSTAWAHYHDSIKIYDQRFKHTEWGQFICEVNATTLDTAKTLDMVGIDVWYLTATNLQQLKKWIAVQQDERHFELDAIVDIASGVVDAVYAVDTGDTEQPEPTADMADETVNRILTDVAAFYLANREYCELAAKSTGYSYAHLGHDFWLTRNGHGAGFWDGDLEHDLGERLSQACKTFGECYIYAGDDNLIYMG